MNKNEKLMILWGLVILISLGLAINSYLTTLQFRVENIISHAGLLMAGAYFLYMAWKNNRKNRDNT